MKPVTADSFILDLGGGGEGIVGKLNGRQVVAIDTSVEELQETKNDAWKVVMDATDLMIVIGFCIELSFLHKVFSSYPRQL